MWQNNVAFRWRKDNVDPIVVDLELIDELIALDEQKRIIYKNIDAFTRGKPALDMLLWGEPGGGKSSMVKLLLRDFSDRYLKVVEFDTGYVKNVYGLYKLVRRQPYYYVIFFDDLSFDTNNEAYRQFKSIVEGGLEEKPRNVIYTVTTNRRFLMGATARDSSDDIFERDEDHERLSLCNRFGLTVRFSSLEQPDFYKIATYYLKKFKVAPFEGWEKEAESFALNKGGRSGRTAKQFAIYKSVVS